MKQLERKAYYDFLRICAAFLVIFNHLPGYTLYQHSEGIMTWIYTFITMLTRVNVPIFFMITGALLLGKSESIKKILKKRVLRIVCVLAIFSALVYLVSGFPGLKFNILIFFSNFLAGTTTNAYAYWFLYAYLAFLVMLPYLRKAVIQIKREDFIYIVVIHFLFYSLLPIINYILLICGKTTISISTEFRVPLMVEKMFFYPIVGYYLDKYLELTTARNRICIVNICAIIGIVISSAITIHQGSHDKFSQNYVQLFDYVTAIAVFLDVKYIFVKKNFLNQFEKIKQTICCVGELTLGIYLLDPVWKLLFYTKVESVLELFLPTLMVSFIWCIISMTIGGVATWVLKKVPLFKQLL